VVDQDGFRRRIHLGSCYHFGVPMAVLLQFDRTGVRSQSWHMIAGVLMVLVSFQAVQTRASLTIFVYFWSRLSMAMSRSAYREENRRSGSQHLLCWQLS
jgi:hypothetical protein